MWQRRAVHHPDISAAGEAAVVRKVICPDDPERIEWESPGK
jgi:hypothetical protein